MPSRPDMSSNTARLQDQLEAAQTRIAELETRLRSGHQHTESDTVIARYAHRMEILHQIDLGIISAKSTEEIVTTALRHIRQLIPCQRANVALIDSDMREGIIFAVDYDKETAIRQGHRAPLQPNFFDGYDERHIKIAQDFRPLQAIEFPFGQLVKEGLLSGLNVMLMDRDKPIGTLGLYADKTDFFTIEHQEIAVEVGNQLAIAIRQHRLVEELAQHAVELEQRVNERTLELQADKARVEALLNNSPNGILLIEPDLSIQQTNTAFHKMMGCESGECASHSLLELIQVEDKETVAKLVQQVIEDRAGKRTEVHVVRKNETVFEAELAVELIVGDGLVCTIQDITERKAYERQLQYHASLQESVSDAVIVIDLENNVQSWNKAAEDVYGWTTEETVGKNASQFLHYETPPEQFALDMRHLQEHGWLKGEIQQFHKDGHPIQIWSSITQIKDKRGNPISVIAVNHDITERKAQERQLRYYGSIQASVSDAVIATDMDLRIQSWNAAAERIYGWTAAEAIGKNAYQILQTVYESEEDRQRVMQEFLAKGGWQREVIQHSKDGRTLHILASTNLFKDDKGQPIGIVSVNRDVTERKQVTEALKKSSAEIHDLYNNAPCGYQSLDKDGLIIQANDTWLNWIGYSREDVVGKLKITDLYTPESVQNFKKNFPRFKERGWVKDLQFEVVCKDGRHMHILLNSTAIYDERGEYLQSRSTIFDITELRKAQLEIRQRETYYRALANNIPSTTVFLFDSDLRYLIVEGPDAAYPPEFMEGKTVQEVFAPDIASQILPGYEAALRGEVTTIVLPDNGRLYEGKFAPVFNEEQMVPNGLLVVRDVTEERAAADALRESEARYRLLADNNSDIIVQVNSAYEYVYVSPSVERLLGYTPQEFVGKTTLYFMHPDDIRVVLASRSENASETVQDTPRTEFRYRHKRGHWVWLERVGTPLYSEGSQELIGFIASLRDITARHQAEESLRQSEGRYRLLAENIDDIIMTFSMDRVITYMSPSCERLLGFSMEEVVGKTHSEFIHPDDYPQVIDKTRQAVVSKADSYTNEFRLRHKDNQYSWYEVRTRVIYDPNSINDTRFISVLRDITERKHAEDALRESESRYRLLVTTLSEGIVMQDRDGIILTCNAAAERILGLTAEQMMGVTSVDPRWQAVHEDGSPFPGETHPGMVTLRTGQALTGVIMGVRLPDGTRHWISINSQPLTAPNETLPYAVIATFSDITSRHEAEAALRESEEKYRSLIDTMHDGLAILDREFHITYVNDRFCEMLDYSRAEIIGKLPTSFVDADTIPLIQSNLGRRQTGESSSYELPLRRRDGRPINVLFSGTPLIDKEGNYKGSFVITTDITVQKQAQDALQQALAKEKELGDLKTRFVSMASHEFRTPLATLLATVETLVAYRQKLSEEQIDQRLDKMKVQIGHLKNIMDDVLMLSRMQARRFDFNPTKINLDALTRSVLDEFQSRPDIQHRLEYTATDSAQEVILDPKLMRQIISNLVSNAIKYSPAGKVVRVKLDYSDAVVALTVIDEGIGIPEADLPHLFEPFHRAVNAENISGTGLGLVITKEAVELHSGAIGVESTVGVGTTFIVRIPIP